MSNINKIEQYPDVSFIDSISLDTVQQEMIADFESKYYELTGKKITLGQADPNRLILYSCALQIYQTMQYIDKAGKSNLLKYAYGDYLENIGAWKGINRNKSISSYTTMRFSIAEIRQSVVTIPKGTRVTAGDEIYFHTDVVAEILIGQMSVDVRATCSSSGVSTNNYDIGKINILVDPIPYIMAVANTTKSEGGADEETDESLAERIYLAQSSYSVAGPEDAYIYWTKTVNQNILDVKVTSPSPVVVDIRFILAEGVLPGEEEIEEVQNYISDKSIRPLTDYVQVSAPETVDYAIDIEYWINESDKHMAVNIQNKVEEAIGRYKIWQRTKIGRDLNPSVLIQNILSAGAKRAVINSPAFTVVPENSVANNISTEVVYGGIESD